MRRYRYLAWNVWPLGASNQSRCGPPRKGILLQGLACFGLQASGRAGRQASAADATYHDADPTPRPLETAECVVGVFQRADNAVIISTPKQAR